MADTSVLEVLSQLCVHYFPLPSVATLILVNIARFRNTYTLIQFATLGMWNLCIVNMITLTQGIALVVYEYIITFSDEIQTVWKRRLTATSFLLLTIRWVMVANVAVASFVPSTPKVRTTLYCSSNKHTLIFPYFLCRSEHSLAGYMTGLDLPCFASCEPVTIIILTLSMMSFIQIACMYT